MKRNHMHILLAAVAATTLMTACHKKTDNAGDRPATTVDVATVVIDSVTLYKTFPSTLNAIDNVDIVCRVNGTLEQQCYESGAMVRKGQVLFTIDPSTYRDELTQAEATLATAVSNNTYAEAHYTAVEKAYARNAVSQMELAQALSDRDTSRASVKQARAALDQARRNLEKCTIRAPFDGRISAGVYSPGAYISGQGAPVVMAQLYNDSKLRAYFYIEDASLLRMYSNDNNRHLIDYDSIPLKFSETLPHNYTARLEYISPDVDTSTGALQLRGTLDNSWGELRSGMYVSVDLPYRVDPEAILVRDASLGTDQLGRYLYVVNDSDQVVYTPVEVGALVRDSMRVVTKGLKPDTRYVVSAMLKVRDGMTVKPRSIDNSQK